MNAKTFFSNLKFVVVGIIIAIGLSYASAASYTEPTGTPPANNTDTPLNIGTTSQVKVSGDCTSNNCGGLSVGAFSAMQNAEFDGQTFFNGVWNAITQVSGGTKISLGNTVAIHGGLDVTKTMQSDKIKSSSGAGICANTNGVLILCSATDFCTNIAGNQSTIPDGYVYNNDNTCTFVQKRFYSVNTDPKVYESPMQQPMLHTNEVQYMAEAAELGIDNDSPNGWQVNDIPGINTTNPFNPTILSVFESGTYVIKISSAGTFQARGDKQGSRISAGIDFFLKVNNTYYSLVSPSEVRPTVINSTIISADGSRLTHESYPATGNTKSHFGIILDPKTSVLGNNGSGKNYVSAPYAFNFEKTFNLNVGDSVQVYAYVYGAQAESDSFLGLGDTSGGPIQFMLTADTGKTIFDITKTQ